MIINVFGKPVARSNSFQVSCPFEFKDGKVNLMPFDSYLEPKEPICDGVLLDNGTMTVLDYPNTMKSEVDQVYVIINEQITLVADDILVDGNLITRISGNTVHVMVSNDR